MSHSQVSLMEPALVVEQRDAEQLTQPLDRTHPASRTEAWRRQFFDAGPVDVTVCIANWNCRDILRACLASLLDQPQGVRVEIIVVDNASTDGADDMVEQEFPEVLLCRNAENLGFARANNQASHRAQGHYLFFLNNDTLVPPGTLSRLVDLLKAHPQVGIVGPLLRDGQGRAQVSYRLQPTLATLLHRTSLLRWTGLFRPAYRRYRRLEFDTSRTRAVDVLMGAAMLVPRELFQAAGGWDEQFTFGGEDLELSARIGRHRLVVYHPAVEITHFGRVSTRQHIGFACSHMTIGFLRYLRKCGHPEWALLLYKLLVTIDAPLQGIAKGCQYLWRRLHGRHAKAEKSLLALRGIAYFLAKGLIPFWKT